MKKLMKIMSLPALVFALSASAMNNANAEGPSCAYHAQDFSVLLKNSASKEYELTVYEKKTGIARRAIYRVAKNIPTIVGSNFYLNKVETPKDPSSFSLPENLLLSFSVYDGYALAGLVDDEISFGSCRLN